MFRLSEPVASAAGPGEICVGRGGVRWLAEQVIHPDRTTVERICAAYGLVAGPGAAITSASRGAVGRIWRLDLGTERFAVKELFWEASGEPVHREAELTAQLAAAGIQLPASVPAASGRFVEKLPADSGGWVRLYRWADGMPVDLADAGVAGRVGDLLGRLHAHALPPCGEADPWYDAVPDPSVWGPLADRALANGERWAMSLARRVGLLRKVSALVTPATGGRQITCHRDLHPDNVLVDRRGNLVLLDWDDAGPACPDRELARLLADWHVRDGKPDARAVLRTLAAYRAADGPGRIRDERSFGMLIACTLNFLHAQTGVALDPGAAAEHRQHARAEISDTLTRLPTPALIAQLIRLAAPG